MWSEPRSARSASGRKSPCVSEITPISVWLITPETYIAITLLAQRLDSSSSEAGASEGLPTIRAFDLYDAAHVVQPGTHALTNAVAQGFRAGGALSAGKLRAAIRVFGRIIWIVGRNNRGAIVVVAGVQNQTHRVPNPFCGLDRPEFVEREHFRFEHRAKDVQFSGLHRLVVRILDLLEQLAIVVEQAANALPHNQFLNNADCEMGFAHANATDQQQAGIVQRKFFDELASRHPRRGQVSVRTVEFEI